MAKVDTGAVSEALKKEFGNLCPHTDWSDDEECKCGASLSHCLACYATLQDIEDQALEAEISELVGLLRGGPAKNKELLDTIRRERDRAEVGLEAWRKVAMEWDAWYKSGQQGMIPYESVKAARELEKGGQQ